jgi:dolichol-phosphate mannosyltransferase
MSYKKQKISLIIPSYNEEEGIKETLKNIINYLKGKKIDYEIILVDDKSTDRTIEIIKKIAYKNKKIKVIIRNTCKGFGFSLIEGSKKASGGLICWIMGDSSDDFKTIPSMIDKINQGYDMVIGSKNISGGSRGDQNKLKAIGSTQYSTIAKFLFKLPVYDITNAFRIFKKEMINKISLENNNFAISPEFAIKAHIAKYKITEVPTVYKDRKFGEAKTKLFRMGMKYYFLLIKYWFKYLFNKL